MKTILILVGKTTDKHFQAGIDDYVTRISHYMPFELITIPELKNTKSLTEDQQKTAEGELIMRQIQAGDTVVLLDEHGKEHRSIEFARWLEQKRNTARRLIFVIRTTLTLEDDLLPPDDTPRLHRTSLSRLHHHQGRTLSPRINHKRRMHPSPSFFQTSLSARSMRAIKDARN